MVNTGKNEAKWRSNYQQLRRFIEENGHLPNKYKIENRKLLNWWKYNQRLIKQEKLTENKTMLLKELGKMRNNTL